MKDRQIHRPLEATGWGSTTVHPSWSRPASPPRTMTRPAISPEAAAAAYEKAMQKKALMMRKVLRDNRELSDPKGTLRLPGIKGGRTRRTPKRR
jgi:hypothetical protein